MKSIHFAPVPNMKGKRTMRFTDVTAENYKERELAEMARREKRAAIEAAFAVRDKRNHPINPRILAARKGGANV